MSEYIEHDRNGVSVGIVEKSLFTFAEPPKEMILENGSTLGPVTLAYETYGELNPDKSNAVLIMHALSGDSHVAGYYSNDDAKPGWWEIMVGPGKGIDTNDIWNKGDYYNGAKPDLGHGEILGGLLYLRLAISHVSV